MAFGRWGFGEVFERDGTATTDRMPHRANSRQQLGDHTWWVRDDRAGNVGSPFRIVIRVA
jgi:hypothetical protein